MNRAVAFPGVATPRILFLDFDGVLNSERHFQLLHDLKVPHHSFCQIDSGAVALVNQIVERTAADVVVTSTWRRLHDVAGLQLMLDGHGFSGRVVGVTPRLGSGPRGLEIQEWIDLAIPHPVTFCILDDDSDMAHLSPHLVQTEGRLGLTPVQVTRAVDMLLCGLDPIGKGQSTREGAPLP